MILIENEDILEEVSDDTADISEKVFDEGKYILFRKITAIFYIFLFLF